MSKTEILTELSHLSTDDLAEVQAKLDELAADAWLDRSKPSGIKNGEATYDAEYNNLESDLDLTTRG